MKQLPKITSLLIIFFLNVNIVYSYDFEVNGIYYEYDSSSQSATVTFSYNDKYSGNIIVPVSVSYNGRTLPVLSIGNNAFSDCTELESVSLPSGLTTIGWDSFNGCTKISKIIIPETVSTIGRGAFHNCTALSKIEIPNNVTYIHQETFKGCSNLTSVLLPENLSYIDDYAFEGCSQLQSISIPAATTFIENGAFSGCPNLETIIFEDNTEIIKLRVNYLYGPFGCKPKMIYLGRPVISFPYSTPCLDVSQAEIISISCNFTSSDLFYGCNTLKTIYSFNENPEGTSFSFSSGAYLNSTLYVPIGMKERYMAAEGWKNFFNIQEMDVVDMWDGKNEPPTSDETKEKCEKPTIRYSNGKLLFESATKGAICQSTITDSDISSYSGNEIQLGVTYNISVYATATGYENSEVSTATLCWIDTEPKTEGIENSISQVRANAILFQSDDGTLNIQGAADGVRIGIYTTSGVMIGSAKSSGTSTSIATGLRNGEIAIVKIGDKSVKVVMR